MATENNSFVNYDFIENKARFFNYDLGAGWTLHQRVDTVTGDEAFRFVDSNSDKAITLENESVKKLRDIFKRIGEIKE